MTTDEFERLPMLIRREDALRLLGVDRKTLDRIRRADATVATVVPGMRQVRYRKLALAKYLTLCDQSPKEQWGAPSERL
jgi:hypothetical protein